jgi:stage V sporulation protein B
LEIKRKPQTFLQGAMILTVSTMLVKVIGAVFKIPLGNLLGGSGMGYFTSAYDLYLPLYSLAMAGLPIAISRLVAERVAERRFADVYKTLKIAQRAFLVTGLTGTIIMVVAIYPYTLYIGNAGAAFSMFAIAPALLFCCIMSSYRGFYEGLRNMYPTAISSVIEALGKLFLGLGLAYLVIHKAQSEFNALGTVFGKAVTISPNAKAEEIYERIVEAASPYASAAAILGITIGSVLATLFLIIYHKASGAKITREEVAASPAAYDGKRTLKMLVVIAIPVVLGSLVSNFSSLIDLLTVQKRLATVVGTSPDTILNMYSGLLPESTVGASVSELVETVPNYLYGCYKGFAYSVFNLVPSITSVLGVSALPVLATAWVEQNKLSIKGNIESMIKVTALIAIPAGIGITVLAGPVLNLLYSGKEKEVAVATPILLVLGLAALFSGLSMPLTNMLQAIGKEKIPVRNIMIGAVIKFVLNFVLVGVPAINIIGAPIGTLVCYIFNFAANFYSLVKHAGVRLDVKTILLKPLFSALLCGAAAFGVYSLMSNIMTNLKLVTVVAIAAAGIVYLAALLLTRCVSKEDIRLFKGNA